MEKNSNNNNIELLIKAYNFAAIKHKNQKRKDPEQTPYINHPIGVAHILSQEGKVNDFNVLIAGILHDTVEDTDTTYDELKENFGEKISKIVEECSDDKDQPKHVRKQKQIEHASHASKEAKLVKLADKLYNLRDLNRQTPVGWNKERIDEYFEWAFKVVNEMRGISNELEKELDEMFEERDVKLS